MTQFLDEVGLKAFWEKFKNKLPYDPQTVAEKNNELVEKDITSMYEDGSLFDTIKSGHFDGVNPGNYFNAEFKYSAGMGDYHALLDRKYKFLVLELDRYYGKSDNTGNSKTQHHIVVILDSPIDFNKVQAKTDGYDGYLQMNPTNTNDGGYIGSKMFKTIIPIFDTCLQASFSNHLKTVSLNLSNTGSKQKPFTYANTLVKSYLPTEYELFGKITHDEESYTQLSVPSIQI